MILRRLIVVVVLMLCYSYSKAQYVWVSPDNYTQFVCIEFPVNRTDVAPILNAKHNGVLSYLSDIVNSKKNEIRDESYNIWVESYVGFGDSDKDNLAAAKHLSNTVKSYLIVNNSLCEADFRTTNYSGTFGGSKCVTVVIVGMRYPVGEISAKQKISYCLIEFGEVDDDLGAEPMTSDLSKMGFDTSALLAPDFKVLSFYKMSSDYSVPSDGQSDLEWGIDAEEFKMVHLKSEFPAMYSLFDIESQDGDTPKLIDYVAGEGFYIVSREDPNISSSFGEGQKFGYQGSGATTQGDISGEDEDGFAPMSWGSEKSVQTPPVTDSYLMGEKSVQTPPATDSDLMGEQSVNQSVSGVFAVPVLAPLASPFHVGADLSGAKVGKVEIAESEKADLAVTTVPDLMAEKSVSQSVSGVFAVPVLAPLASPFHVGADLSGAKVGKVEIAESEKADLAVTKSDKVELAVAESDKVELAIAESDKAELAIAESEKVELVIADSQVKTDGMEREQGQTDLTAREQAKIDKAELKKAEKQAKIDKAELKKAEKQTKIDKAELKKAERAEEIARKESLETTISNMDPAQLDVLSIEELVALGASPSMIRKLEKSKKAKSAPNQIRVGRTADGSMTINAKSYENKINEERLEELEIQEKEMLEKESKAIKRLESQAKTHKRKEIRLDKGRFAVAGVGVNALSTAVLIPALQVDGYFSDRFAASAEYYYSKWNFNPSNIFNISMGTAEVKFFVMGKKKEFEGLYIGVYGMVGEYDFRWDSEIGRQSDFWSAGLSIGYVLPLGAGFYLDAGISGGYVSEKIDKYLMYNDVYFDLDERLVNKSFLPTKIKVTFVYRIFNQKR